MKWNLTVLCLLLLATLLLVGCGKAQTDTEQTTTAPIETSAETTEAPTAQKIVLVEDGKTSYAVIRDEDLATDDPGITMCHSVLNEIKTLTGATATFGTDWWRAGKELDPEKPEILVGVTDHPETKQVMESLGYGEYAVRVVGNKIVIFGYDTASLSTAVALFNRTLKSGVSEDGKSISLTAEEIEHTGVKNQKLAALPLFEGGVFGAYYQSGDACEEIIVRNVTPQMYDAYLDKLAAAGFEKYTEYQMANNLFATFTNEKYTVTAGYYDHETSVRLLIEPLAPAVGLAADNVYTPVTTTQMTLLGQEFIDDKGEQIANGQSLLIRLADGRFIIIDGGYNRTDVAQELLATMREQAAGYAKSDKDIKIAAWILTHVHSDHMGALLAMYKSMGDIKVERLLVTYLSETERVRAMGNSTVKANWGSGEGTGAGHIPSIAKTLGAELHYVHVGQVYHFADVKFEVLYTIESYGPKVCNALNTTSAVMKFDLAGTTYLSTGDASGDAMALCADMYGDYLKSDIVQVCHHGSSTYGNENGMIKAYQLTNAATVLWPRSFIRYDVAVAGARNAVLFKVPNYKEDYVAGAIGDRVVMSMPYTPGTATVTRVK